jgi:hypothetical protein
MSSDSTGEIYVLVKTGGWTGTGTPSSSSATSSTTEAGGAARRPERNSGFALGLALITCLMRLV